MPIFYMTPPAANFTNTTNASLDRLRNEFERLIGDIGLGTHDGVRRGFQDANQALNYNTFPIDVCISSNYPAEELDILFQKWGIGLSEAEKLDIGKKKINKITSCEGIDYPFRISLLENIYATRLGDFTPTLLILLLHIDNTTEINRWNIYLEQWVTNRPLVLLINPDNCPDMGFNLMGTIQRCCVYKQFKASAFPTDFLTEIHDIFKNPIFRQLANAYGYMHTLSELGQALKQHVEEETTRNRNQRLGLQGKVALSGSAFAEYTANFKAVLPQLDTGVGNFTAKFEEGMNTLFTFPSGSLAKKYQSKIESLTETHKETKVDKMMTSIPKAFSEALLADIRKDFEAIIQEDLKKYEELIENVQNAVAERTSMLLNYTPPPLQKVVTSQEQVNLLLDRVIKLTPYNGSLKIYTVMQLINSARGGLMLIAAVMGIGGMIWKEFRQEAAQYIAPFAVAALVGGIYSTYSKTKKEKEESLKSDIEKARENLNTQVRNMLREFQSSWSMEYRRLIQSQLASYPMAFSSSLNSYNAETTASANEVKAQLGNKLSALTSVATTINNQGRAIDTFQNSINMGQATLKNQFSTSFQTAPRNQVGNSFR